MGINQPMLLHHETISYCCDVVFAYMGIKKGIMELYDFYELPTPKQMMEKSKSWQPHRTIASWYLWSVLENN